MKLNIWSQSFIEIFIPFVDDVSPLLRAVPDWTLGSWSLFLPLLFRLWPLLLKLSGMISLLSMFPLSVLSPLPSFSSPSLELIYTLWSLLSFVFWMLQVHLLEKLFLETFGERFDMHIVAVASSFAAPIDVLLAFGIQEISNWWEYGTYLFALEKSSIYIVEGILRVLLITVLYIYVAHNVITQIVNHYHIFNFTVLTHFLENLLEKLLESTLS